MSIEIDQAPVQRRSAEVRQMIEQMAEIMMRQDEKAVLDYFAEDGVMIAPSGRYVGHQAIYDTLHDFNQGYTNIIIEIKDVLCCGQKGYLEWSFAETRKSDGWTHVMEDSIVFHLREGDDKVLYWREYFDPLQEELI